MNAQWIPNPSRLAYANGILGAFAVILIFIFFAVGEPFGTLNDITGLLWGLTLAPLMYVFYQRAVPRTPSSTIAFSAGLIGCAAFIVLQLLLLLRVLTFEQQYAPLTLTYGLIGVWMILVSRAARRAGELARGLAWFGIAIGAMWALTSVLTWLGGPIPSDMSALADPSKINPFLLLSFITFFFAYLAQPIWALWLGRVFKHPTAPTASVSAVTGE